MSYETNASVYELNGTAIPSANASFSNNSINTSTLEGHIDMSANGLNSRSHSGQGRKYTSLRDVKLENQDWLAAQIAQRSVIDVVNATGMTDKAVQNIRQRRAKISFDNLVELCRNDPEFAAEFAAHIGLILPGEAEMAAVVTRLVNAHVRRKG